MKSALLITSLLITILINGSLLLAQSPIEQAIKEVINYEHAENAILGLSIVNTNTNEELYAYNSNFGLKPASSQKVITTATALGILGENFKFETKIWAKGIIENGVLKGDLIIQGGGDPSLGFMRYSMGKKSKELFREWITKIKQAGITSIEGDIIGDPSIFDSQLVSPQWIWEDIGNYYGAGVSGLNFHENKYEVQFLPDGKEGDKAEIILVNPPMDNVEFLNEVRIGASNSGDQAYIYCAPYSNTVVIRGTVPKTSKPFTIKGAVQNPALFTASWFKKELEKQGITINGKADFNFVPDADLYNNAQLIHTHTSAPLKEIVFWANKKSINIYCEALVKMIGLKTFKSGSYTKGLEAIKNYWQQRGVNISGWELKDGSGLSPANALPPNVHANILAKMTKESYFQSLDHSLSWACVGDYGNLGQRLCGTESAENLRAKSGYINKTRTYAGFVENRCGDLVSFSVMLNNYHCTNSRARKLLLLIMEQIVTVE